MKTEIIEFDTYLEKSSPMYFGYDIDDILIEKILSFNQLEFNNLDCFEQ